MAGFVNYSEDYKNVHRENYGVLKSSYCILNLRLYWI